MAGVMRTKVSRLDSFQAVRKGMFGVYFMVKLLRACVWMPWRQQTMKDVANCDKPRGEVSIL